MTDANRQKYGLTERDDATGLDHTWWRKLESFAGRWTSPDPYNGSMTNSDPQSCNRYAHVQNDPVNFVDPSGLDGKPGDLCPGGVIGNDGKCHAGPSAVVTVGIPPSLFGDYLPNWTSGQSSIIITLLGGGPGVGVGGHVGGSAGGSRGSTGGQAGVKQQSTIPKILSKINHVISAYDAANNRICREYMGRWYGFYLHVSLSPGPALIMGLHCGLTTPY